MDPLSSLQSLVDLREDLPGDPDPLLVLLHALVAHDHAVAEPRVVADDGHRLLRTQCLWSGREGAKNMKIWNLQQPDFSGLALQLPCYPSME